MRGPTSLTITVPPTVGVISRPSGAKLSAPFRGARHTDDERGGIAVFAPPHQPAAGHLQPDDLAGRLRRVQAGTGGSTLIARVVLPAAVSIGVAGQQRSLPHRHFIPVNYYTKGG